jgi:DNA-binding GntR family transcriptional regulator
LVKEIRLDEVEELFRIREALEILAVEEGIRNYAAEGIKQIEKALVAHREYDYSTPHRHRWFLDMSFHLKIAEMGKNRNLVQLLRYVLERIYLPLRVEGISPQRLALTAGEHQDVFDAIRRKDTAQAKRLMKKHLKAGKISTIRGTQLVTRILQY